MLLNIAILFILLLFSAFFSASEVSFVSLSDAKVDTMIERKLPRSTLIKKLKQNPRRLLITVLIGNNFVNIAAASLATMVMTAYFKSAIIGITTGVMTLIVLIFGEIVPKSYAINHTKRIAIFSAPLLQLLEWVFLPAIIVFEWFTNTLAGKHRQEHVSEEEIKALSARGAKQGTIEQHEHRLIKRLFRLNDTTVEKIMSPRNEVVFIEDTMAIENATEIIEHYTFTRYPIYHESTDTIIGYIHVRDVLMAHHRQHKHISIAEIMRPVVWVNQHTFVDDLLTDFQKNNTHMAIVITETKKILGVVTLEDVIEELVGEIFDEFDIE